MLWVMAATHTQIIPAYDSCCKPKGCAIWSSCLGEREIEWSNHLTSQFNSPARSSRTKRGHTPTGQSCAVPVQSLSDDYGRIVTRRAAPTGGWQGLLFSVRQGSDLSDREES